MKNFKKIGTILFLSAYLFIGFSVSPVFAADEVKFIPQISIPGSEFQQGVSTTVGSISSTTVTSDLLARYVKAFYNWGLSIVGVLAVLMLMAGGLIWLTSAGDSGKIDNAKKMISGSLFGTLLLVGAYFFLNTINPDLAKLPVIEMDVIEKKSVGAPTTCSEANESLECARLGFCYWENNKCITKTESVAISGGSLCSINKADIKEKYPQCCCESDRGNYINCKWSVSGKNTYCNSSCGATFASVPESYCK